VNSWNVLFPSSFPTSTNNGGRIQLPRRTEEVKRQQQHHSRKTIGREGKDIHGAVYERLENYIL